MKYHISKSPPTYDFRVRLEGPLEEEEKFCNLALSLVVSNKRQETDNIRVHDELAGKAAYFDDEVQFLKFMKWRAIFYQCHPNKQFSFIKFARKAVKMVKEDLNKNAIYADSYYDK